MSSAFHLMRVAAIIGGSLGALVGGVLVASYVGRARFARQVEQEVAHFLADATPTGRELDVEAETADLPPPVRRYLRSVLGPRTRELRSTTFMYGGAFRMKPGAPLLPMQSEEYVRLDRPGYIWHGHIRMGPMLWADVRDLYAEGRGAMLGKLNSTVTIVKSETPEVALGALTRWAAEAPWFPQAFLNRKVFTWQAIDDRSARVVVQDSGMRATFTCVFGVDGRIERMTTEDRLLERNGHYERHPYSGVFHDWRQVDGGVWVPGRGEAVWSLPEGEFDYVHVDLSPQAPTL